ncbi:MAG: glycosyltransferase, partial [Victivallaceae bacterium]
YVRETLSKFPQAKYLRKISSSAVPKYVAKAKCGLCLSREEGAMFVSAEYLLCGKPIVNTPNIGGRDYLFPDFAAITVNEPTPETIADAVAQLAANPPEPEKIRRATIEKMLFYRDILQQRLKHIYQEEGFALPSGDIHLPHKLGLRCTLMPWTHWRHGLRRQN